MNDLIYAFRFRRWIAPVAIVGLICNLVVVAAACADSVKLSDTPLRPTKKSCLVTLGPNQVGALGILGKLTEVCAHGQKRWAYASQIQQQGVFDLGYPPDLEQLLRLKPSLVLVNGGPWAIWEQVPWMQQLGLSIFNYLDFLEHHPLDRFAWALILGAKLGVEQNAVRVVAEFSATYKELQQKAKAQKEQRPLVLLGSLQGDTWVAPPGDQWMANLITDAGGRYLWEDAKREVRLPWEQILRLGKKVQIWIPLNHWQQRSEIMAEDQRYAFVPFISGKIINNNQRLNSLMANDFWESGLYHPHELLAELQQILHPEWFSEKRDVTQTSFKWWRPL